MSRKSEKENSNGKTTIGFRLDEDYRAELLSRATSRKLSEHELARIYVQEMLTSDIERAELRDAIKTLFDEVQALRDDLVFSVEALLCRAGTLSKEEAKAWVDEAFKAD